MAESGRATKRVPHRGRSLVVLIVNQLLAGVGVAAGIAVAALLVEDLSGVTALAGLAQSSSVLGAAIAAIPLARLAARSGRHVALASGYAFALLGAALIVVAAVTAVWPLVFGGLLAFGAGTAAGLQSRFAATELAAPGFEARAMSVVMWATTLGSVAGPLLADTGDVLGRGLGLPPLVGPFVLSGIGFAASTLLVATLLRVPRAGALAADADPGATPDAGAASGAGATPDAGAVPVGAQSGAQSGAEPAEGRAPASTRGDDRPVGAIRALGMALRDARARFAVLAIVCSHTVMVGVMVMTPVHMHAHGLSLALVGIVVAVHVVGMYGASPLFGWLVDRIGPERVIVIGGVVLLATTLIGILAPADDMVVLPLALGLLGLGWSAGLIGGSTLLTRAAPPAARVPLQGATDAAMNVAAAVSAALSGVILGIGGFAAVNVVALIVLVPLAVAGVQARAARTAAAR